MKLNRELLLRELSFVARAAAKAPDVHAILKYALWRVDGNRLTIEATDTETSLRAGLDLDEEVAEPYALAVPASASVSVLDKMDGDTVDLEIEGSEWRVRDALFKGRLSGLAPDEWPEAPELEEDPETLEIASDVVLSALAAVKHAAARPGSRYAAPGSVPIILAVDEDGKLTAAAAHEHRGAISGSVAAVKNHRLRIPLRVEDVATLESFGEVPGEWSIRTDGRRTQFSSALRQASLRSPEGQFPNVPSLIENLSSLPHSFAVDREQFLRAARVASSCPGIDETAVTVVLGEEGDMEIIGRGAWSEMRAKCVGEVDGAAEKLGFTGVYLVDLAESLTAKRITVRYENTKKPVLVESESDNGKEFRVVAARVL